MACLRYKYIRYLTDQERYVVAKKKIVKPARRVSKQQLSHFQRQKKLQRLVFIIGIVVVAVVVGVMSTGYYLTSYRPLHETAITVNGTRYNMAYYLDMLRLQSRSLPPSYISYMSEAVIQDIEQREIIVEAAAQLGITASNDEVSQGLKKANLPSTAVTRDLIRGQLVTDKLKNEYFDKQVPQQADQTQIMAILVESQAQAEAIRARLVKGESFADIAQQLSLAGPAKTNKGDYGVHPQSVYPSVIGSEAPVDYAFGNEAGSLSPPLYDAKATKSIGYWLIKVVEMDKQAGEAHVQAMVLGSEDEALKIKDKLAAGEDFAALAKASSQLPGADQDGGDMPQVAKGEKTKAFDAYVFDPQMELGKVSNPIQDDTLTTTGGYWLVKIVAAYKDRQISDDDRNVLKTKALNDWASGVISDPRNTVDHSALTTAKKSWAILRITREAAQNK